MKRQVEIDIEEFRTKVAEGASERSLMSFYKCGRTTITEFKRKHAIYSPPRNSIICGKKTCSICDRTLDEFDFYSNGYSNNGVKKYKPSCKTCENERVFHNYRNNIEKALKNLRKEYACEKCGYDSNSSAIEFHHINPDEKKHTISDMKCFSLAFIQLELEKCLVLCANCHRELHNPTRFKY